jgi:hypothetical protein
LFYVVLAILVCCTDKNLATLAGAAKNRLAGWQLIITTETGFDKEIEAAAG